MAASGLVLFFGSSSFQGFCTDSPPDPEYHADIQAVTVWFCLTLIVVETCNQTAVYAVSVPGLTAVGV